MKRILLKCPICEKSRIQRLPETLLESRNQYEKGIVAILIPKNTVCEHNFLIHVDKNFSIRDVITIDMVKEYNSKKMVKISELNEMIKTLKAKSIKNLLMEL